MSVYGPQQLVQTAFAEISANQTTTSTTFADFLTITLVTGGNSTLLVYFDASFSSSSDNDGGKFQIVIDGTAYRGTASGGAKSSNGDMQACSLSYRSAQLAPGSHTVKIQWASINGATLTINPVTTILSHASLLVEEVTV